MMGHKILIFFLIILVTVFTIKTFGPNVNSKYVFINETNDHRFDESIKMSIVSAQLRTKVQNAIIISNRDEISSNLEMKAPLLFKQLHLGDNSAGRAILYIYCPIRRLLKIEVGYELEGQLPDSKLKSLELAAKSFTYTDKFQDFWAELINTINIEISNKEKDKTPNDKNSEFDFSKFNFNSGGAGVFSNQYSVDWSQLKKEVQIHFDDRKYLSNENLTIALDNYLASVSDGISDSHLDVLDDESKLFRKHNLITSYQMFRNSRMYIKAGIDSIISSQKIAFVFFKKENPVLPIILINSGKRWQVSEVLSWGLFQRFENSNLVMLKYPLTGFEKELTNYLARHFSKPQYDLESKITYENLIQLEFRNNFKNNMLKFYWPEKTKFEMQSRQLNTLSNDELKFVADAYINLGEVSNFLQTYKLISERLPSDKQIQQNFKFYQSNLIFNKNDWVLSLQ